MGEECLLCGRFTHPVARLPISMLSPVRIAITKLVCQIEVGKKSRLIILQDKDRTYDVKYKHILPYFKGTDGVPAIFLEYYPKISVADFKLIKKDGQFLERKARVCDSCYIEFTEV